MKLYFGELLDDWLEDGENFEKWCSPKFLTASQRRILIGQLLGSAWNRQQVKAAKNKGVGVDKVFLRYFERCGCALTIDGSGDDLISIEKLRHFYGEGKKWTFDRSLAAINRLTVGQQKQAAEGDAEQATDEGAGAQLGRGGLLDLLNACHLDDEGGEGGEIDADMSEFRLLSSESDYTLSSDAV